MEIISQIQSIYCQIDKQVAEFQLKTGLRCPTGCGACCPTADVEATVLEMLPAAHQILSQGVADLWCERIAVQTPTDLCVFYDVGRLANDPGHCVFYHLRPAICRLFGFAAVHTRSGESALAACGYLKRGNSQATQKALKCQHQAPGFSALTTQLYSLEPSPRIEFLPINQALYGALLRMGLSIQLAHGEALSQTTVA